MAAKFIKHKLEAHWSTQFVNSLRRDVSVEGLNGLAGIESLRFEEFPSFDATGDGCENTMDVIQTWLNTEMLSEAIPGFNVRWCTQITRITLNDVLKSPGNRVLNILFRDQSGNSHFLGIYLG